MSHIINSLPSFPLFPSFYLYLLHFFSYFIFPLLLSQDAAKSLRVPIKARWVILASISAIGHRGEFRRVPTACPVRASRKRHRRIKAE